MTRDQNVLGYILQVPRLGSPEDVNAPADVADMIEDLWHLVEPKGADNWNSRGDNIVYADLTDGISGIIIDPSPATGVYWLDLEHDDGAMQNAAPLDPVLFLKLLRQPENQDLIQVRDPENLRAYRAIRREKDVWIVAASGTPYDGSPRTTDRRLLALRLTYDQYSMLKEHAANINLESTQPIQFYTQFHRS